MFTVIKINIGVSLFCFAAIDIFCGCCILNMKKVYFLSGLGADKRSFGFLDLSFCNPYFIQWITPSHNETLGSYAEKLFESVNDEKAVIVGLSFGGMLAVEIAKKHPETQVIIIASAKTRFEIPRYLRFWRHFPVYNFHSTKTKNYGGRLILSILGTKGAEQRKVQQQIMKDSDPSFTRWAIHAILHWKNTVVPENVVHIHGTADKLLPFKFVKADYTITSGEHVMIMDKAEEITALLKKLITE